MKDPEKLADNNTSFRRMNRAINLLGELYLSLRPSSSPTVHPKHTSRGTSWEVILKQLPDINVRQLAIKTVAANYLICNPVDESDEIDTTTDFTVAKDPTFRGNDPRQIVGPNGVLVSQDLDPHYEIGQIIYAVFGVNVDSDAVDANGDSIEVLEISPSRQWVDQWVKVCATVDGVQHQIAVRGTGILPGT